jgi:hypothetical protein
MGCGKGALDYTQHQIFHCLLEIRLRTRSYPLTLLLLLPLIPSFPLHLELPTLFALALNHKFDRNTETEGSRLLEPPPSSIRYCLYTSKHTYTRELTMAPYKPMSDVRYYSASSPGPIRSWCADAGAPPCGKPQGESTHRERTQRSINHQVASWLAAVAVGGAAAE